MKHFSTPSDTISLPFIDCSRPNWYLRKSDLKSSWMISSVSKPVMISTLSLSEYIRRFSMGPVNFRCQMNFPFATCFKHNYGLVLSRYCSIVSCSLPSLLQSAYLSWKDILIRKGFYGLYSLGKRFIIFSWTSTYKINRHTVYNKYFLVCFLLHLFFHVHQLSLHSR